MGDMITISGFYDGRFYKAGQRKGVVPNDTGTADLTGMTKDELLAVAETRGLQVRSSDTKAEIIEALEGAA